MKWYSTKQFMPGDEYKPQEGYITPEFYVIYHHGDNELMTNLAWWNGSRFILGTLCYCTKCQCDCYYSEIYSDECEVTHWMPLEFPDFEMDIYSDERCGCEITESENMVIRIELRKCPVCATEFSEIAGLRSTADGEQWVQTCNNRECTFEMVTPVNR